jgi:hypothetical protein
VSLPTVQNLKDYLRIETTAEDGVVAALLASAMALATAYLDRPITAASRTYTVEDRRAASLGLSRLSYDPSAATFIRVPDAPVDVSQPVTITDRFGTVLDATQYRVEAATGLVRNGGANSAYGGIGFAGFPYTIVATTGLATRADYATVVEPCVFQSILDIGADLYQRRNPSATDENDGAGGSIRYGRSEETLPTRAIAMLDPFRRPQL